MHPTLLRRILGLSLLTWIIGFAIAPAIAQQFKVIHTFEGYKEGFYADAPLIEGSDGRLYGVTSQGGHGNTGVIFATNPDGSGFVILHHFHYQSEGQPRNNGLLQGSDGRLYGVTRQFGLLGGGTVYALNTDGSGFTILRHFNDQTEPAYPVGELVQGSDGRLYGVTESGGPTGYGGIFVINSDGSGFQVLHTLAWDTEGWSPLAGPIFGSDGRLYGTASQGGPAASRAGTIWAFDPSAPVGTGFRMLHAFDQATEGAKPLGRLLEASDGRIYGTTSTGTSTGATGQTRYGTVFGLNKDGSGFAACPFDGSTHGLPETGVIEGDDGRLYGTTWRGVYAVAKNLSPASLTTIIAAPTGGWNSYAELLRSSDGRLYSASVRDGQHKNGTLFRVNQDGTGYNVLRHLSRASSGQYPRGPLVESTDGRLWGVAYSGGDPLGQGGVVFSINRDGTGYTVQHDFLPNTTGSQASSPSFGVSRGSDGRFYGLTEYGFTYGRGGLYAFDPNTGGMGRLHSFLAVSGDGYYPRNNGVIQGIDGRIYGTAPGNQGILFAMTPEIHPITGSDYTILHFFDSNNDGYNPHGNLIQMGDGRLFGAAQSGGAGGAGTLYVLNPDGTDFAVLHHFVQASDGGSPVAGLTKGIDGRLYGMTSAGGNGQGGTIFAIDPDTHEFGVLHHFLHTQNGGHTPTGALALGPDGRLYGATIWGGDHHGGVLFAFEPATQAFTVLHHFHPDLDGSGNSSVISVIFASDGVLYGTAGRGGRYWYGTIFSYSLVPDISSPLTATGTFAQPFSYTITATNSPDDFDALGLPTNLAVNHATGEISGVPAQTGDFAVTIAASNGFGADIENLDLSIAKATGVISLSNLAQTYDGLSKSVTVQTAPTNVSVTVHYNGSSQPPINAGSYSVAAAIDDPNYAGSASGTLTITPALQTITFPPIPDHVFGDAPFAIAATSSSGLPVSFTIESGPATVADDVVTLTGSGAVTIRAVQGGDSNHLPAPAVEQTFNVAPASATVVLSNLTQDFDDTPKEVSVSTTPVGLTTSITYNGSATPPTNAGSYTVVATVIDPNYAGAATATLVIATPAPVPADVTASLTITRGGFRLNRATGRFAQTITVVNASGQPISGPVSFVFDQLSPNATLFAPAGTTSAVAPLGSPYLHLNSGADGVLGIGESVSHSVEFTNSSNASITYTTRVLAGPGTR